MPSQAYGATIKAMKNLQCDMFNFRSDINLIKKNKVKYNSCSAVVNIAGKITAKVRVFSSFIVTFVGAIISVVIKEQMSILVQTILASVDARNLHTSI